VLPAWCDKVDRLLETFRLSWLWPVLNDTSSGDEGWDARFGEALAWLSRDGEAALLLPLLADMVRFSGTGSIGLDSKDGTDEHIAGDVIAEADLL